MSSSDSSDSTYDSSDNEYSAIKFKEDNQRLVMTREKGK